MEPVSSWCCSVTGLELDRTGNGHKQKDRKPHLNTRENIFTVKMVKHRSRLFRRIKESSSLGYSESNLTWY